MARAAPDGGDDAQRQADQQLAEDGADHQQQRRRQARDDQLGDFGLLHIGAAEIALSRFVR